MYKIVNDGSAEMMKEIFIFHKTNKYNLRHQQYITVLKQLDFWGLKFGN